MPHTLTGVGGAPGVALGPAAHLAAQAAPAAPADASPQAALARFAQGRASAAERLRALAQQFRDGGHEQEAGIFDAQALLVEDDFLSEEVARLVNDEQAPLEQAVRQTTAAMRATLEALDDDYLRERAADMDAVGQEILLAIGGQQAQADIPPGAIILADDLTPTQTAGLRGGSVAGFATAYGGPTGHTAILARSLGIPAAVGLGPGLLGIAPGTPLILDGGAATLIADPTPQQQASYRQRAEELAAAAARQSALRGQPGQLADGTPVALWANIGSPDEARAARASGAEGVGLFRTEFLFLDRASAPSEDEQYHAYRAVLEAMEGGTVVVRTLDIGGDKPLPYLPMPHEENPFLGVRALRLCMAQPLLFHTQLRALLRAAPHGDLWVMLPMVATLDDLRWGKARLRAAAQSLADEGIAHRADLPVGIMIETPAAAVTADILAREAAFFSVGSNDLTQYAMAADRGQSPLAARYTHKSPAVLRLIQLAAQAAHAAGIPIGLCGELAADPEAALALAGLGLDELSMVPAAIPSTKEQLGQATLAQAQQAAQRMLAGEH
ncbi:phosphoenolpyruvate--protein phosphotransferase [Chloroflexia bacterium SDU3-3]|nr:phosphoenolpyruvate--protein phosphotransferase [Chloroflexia bacterium SDU3-3]